MHTSTGERYQTECTLPELMSVLFFAPFTRVIHAVLVQYSNTYKSEPLKIKATSSLRTTMTQLLFLFKF